MTITLGLIGVGAGAAAGALIALAPQALLGIARANLRAFMRNPPDDAAILLLLRLVGAGLAVVLGSVFSVLLVAR